MTEQPQEEKLPVDDSIDIKDYRTIYKSSKWWCAVVFGNMFGHDKIMVYQWQWNETKKLENGKWIPSGIFKWKRKQKFGINFEKDWIAIKAAVDEFLPKMLGVKV
jgi:hypothetical protein